MENSLLRGDIYLVNLDPTIGGEIKKTRPAMIISNNINNKHSLTVTVLPITSNVKKVFPFELVLPAKNIGLVKDSKLKCDQIRTIDKSRLIKFLGHVPDNLMRNVEQSVCNHLGIY